MPKYVIERDVADAGKLSDEQLREISLRSLDVLGELGPKIQWIHSYVTDNKIYCVYLAPDEETLHEHARRAGLPADRISAVRRLLDPTNY
jgi:Nickel responsive protein SCO4226-like